MSQLAELRVAEFLSFPSTETSVFLLTFFASSQA